ncbi:MAG: polymerase beta domain protein region [Cyanobacteria bacterium RYN_339]|nr:polymerase beta domain protein region [Cyanobacteria bacterium RYN_339]
MTFGLPVDHDRLVAFCRQWQVAELALFGSILRPDFTPDSDVDVLVTWLPEARVSLLVMGEMAAELEAIFGRPVDLVPKDGLKPLIRDEVLDSARVVYAAA